MATHRGFIPGYIGSPPVTPYRPPAQTEAERLASIAAIGERNRQLQEQRAELEAAKLKSQAAAAKAQRDAQQILLQTRTNAAWNEMLAKTAAKEKAKNIKVVTKDKDDNTTTRELTPKQFAAEQAAKNAPKIADLLAKKADMVKNIEAGDNRYGFANIYSRPNRVAELDSKLAELQPPPDLLSGSSDLVAPTTAAAAPVVAPKPQGWGVVGTPTENTFLMDPTPKGLNREQTNRYAINLNNGVPTDLLRSQSFPSGYQPGHGSFQMDAAPPAAAAPVEAVESNMRWDQPQAQGVPAIPKSHIAHLLANPDTAADFDAKHGEGAADAYLREQP